MIHVPDSSARRSRVVPGIVVCLLATVVAAGGCGDDSNRASRLADSAPAAEFDAAIAAGWFDHLYTLVKENGVNPPHAARRYGYAGVVLYEVVVHGVPGGRSLAGQLNGLGDLPAPVDAVHHWPLGANAALAELARGFFPGETERIDAWESAHRAPHVGDVPAGVVARSEEFGRRIAAAVLAWADGDGHADAVACGATFVPPVPPEIGGWVPTGAGPTLGLEPCWGGLRTFALVAASDCAAPGAPEFSTDPASPFYAAALEVYEVTGDSGASLSADAAEIAHYWADGAGATGTPPGHWIAIVGPLLGEHGLGLDAAAEVYARVGVAVADAFIVCWMQKYATYLLRPVTYIQSVIDAEWTPLLGTPPFPSYTSGHSTQSSAAASVLTGLFGAQPFTDTTHSRLNPELGLADRPFANFVDAAAEAAISRLYGGIHYSFDNDDGFDQGLCIAAVHGQRLRLRD